MRQRLEVEGRRERGMALRELGVGREALQALEHRRQRLVDQPAHARGPLVDLAGQVRLAHVDEREGHARAGGCRPHTGEDRDRGVISGVHAVAVGLGQGACVEGERTRVAHLALLARAGGGGDDLVEHLGRAIEQRRVDDAAAVVQDAARRVGAATVTRRLGKGYRGSVRRRLVLAHVVRLGIWRLQPILPQRRTRGPAAAPWRAAAQARGAISRVLTRLTNPAGSSSGPPSARIAWSSSSSAQSDRCAVSPCSRCTSGVVRIEFEDRGGRRDRLSAGLEQCAAGGRSWRPCPPRRRRGTRSGAG